MNYELSKLQKVYLPFKRCFDVVFSLIALTVFSPLFLVVAILIKLDSPGPVIFKQQRPGKGGVPFTMYKFRSMHDGAENELKNMEAFANHESVIDIKQRLKNDPRITKFGKSLRASSIDELPQLINVFIGNMSLIGPRPIPTYEHEAMTQYQQQRTLVKPGITCTWQVSGRGDLCEDVRVEMDLRYIRELNLLTDIAIFFKTIPAVITGKGAY